jgi:hypothetical protein
MLTGVRPKTWPIGVLRGAARHTSNVDALSCTINLTCAPGWTQANMGLRIKNGKWEYRFLVKGQPVQVAAGLAATERNRKAAERKEQVHREAILEGRWGPATLTPRAFKDVLSEFEKFCRVEYAPHPASVPAS